MIINIFFWDFNSGKIFGWLLGPIKHRKNVREKQYCLYIVAYGLTPFWSIVERNGQKIGGFSDKLFSRKSKFEYNDPLIANWLTNWWTLIYYLFILFYKIVDTAML